MDLYFFRRWYVVKLLYSSPIYTVKMRKIQGNADCQDQEPKASGKCMARIRKVNEPTTGHPAVARLFLYAKVVPIILSHWGI